MLDANLPARLAHVFWIGGPPDCGKTSIADLLAERHGLRVYHFDRQEPAHIRRADPTRHPNLSELRRLVDELDEPALARALWLDRGPEEMARFTIGSWSERCELAVEDLLALPAQPPIVAEGPGFFPERIAPLLTSPDAALWLIPSEAFKRASVERRGKPGAGRLTPDPARARENLIARDLLLGEHVAREAQARSLPLHSVDGSLSLDEVTALIDTRLRRFLDRCTGSAS